MRQELRLSQALLWNKDKLLLNGCFASFFAFESDLRKKTRTFQEQPVESSASEHGSHNSYWEGTPGVSLWWCQAHVSLCLPWEAVDFVVFRSDPSETRSEDVFFGPDYTTPYDQAFHCGTPGE